MLDQKMGAGPSCQAIMEIKDHRGVVLNLDRELVNNCSDTSRRGMPLIEAREVDGDFRFTGRRYAYGAGSGVVRICNPFTQEQLVFDSSDYRYPMQRSQSDGGCPEAQPVFACASPVKYEWNSAFGTNGWSSVWGDPPVETALNRLRLSHDDVVERATSLSGIYVLSHQVTGSGGTPFTPSVHAFALDLPSLRREGDGIQLGGDSYGGAWNFDSPPGFAYQYVPNTLVGKVTTSARPTPSCVSPQRRSGAHPP